MSSTHPGGHTGALQDLYGATPNHWTDSQWEVWAMRILLDSPPAARDARAAYMVRGYTSGIIGATPEVIGRALATVNTAHDWTGL